MTNQKDIFSYLVPGKCAHLAGIGGVSMSPLAEVLHGMGLKVQGSDMNAGPAVEHLRSLGIPVAIGHAADNLGECDFVIRTAAIHDDNPEISGAVTRGIPVFERAQAWGAIMKGYKNALCISGTHGKTTTTSMATHIFMAAQKDPTVMIGGTLQLLHAGYRVGKGDTIIAESCEYCNSFLSFFPTVAVILNVEADHLDFFKDLADVEHSFRRFAELVPIGGHVVANMDDQGARDALRGISQPIFWFSYDDPAAQCRAENVVWTDGLPSFDIYIRGSYYAHVSLRVGGKHNVMNALAAASAAYLLGVSGEAVGLGLATFTGAGRRFEYKGSFHGADVYDDYAHHPTEVAAVLRAARPRVGPGGRLVACFQPHLFSRTRDFLDEFAAALSLADEVVVCGIYPAREEAADFPGVTATALADRVRALGHDATVVEDLADVAPILADLVRPGDLVLTIGAGSITTAGPALVTLLEERA